MPSAIESDCQHCTEVYFKLLVRLAIVCMLLSFSGYVFGSPFQREYRICLNEINVDGGLELAIPLGRLPVKVGSKPELWLEHKIENLDYGEAESRFVLRPMETSIFAWGENVWRWERPGGGTILFTHRISAPVLPNAVAQLLSSSESDALVCYSSGKNRCWIVGPTRQIVCSDGWIMSYRRGELEAVNSPDGTYWTVLAKHGRILEIRGSDATMAKIQWSVNNEAEILSVGGDTIRFEHEQNRLMRIARNTSIDTQFEYDTSGLLRAVASKKLGRVHYEWKTTLGLSNSRLYVAPYVLAVAGSSQFYYDVGVNMIRIRVLNGRSERRLTVKTLYGRITSIVSQ